MNLCKQGKGGKREGRDLALLLEIIFLGVVQGKGEGAESRTRNLSVSNNIRYRLLLRIFCKYTKS